MTGLVFTFSAGAGLSANTSPPPINPMAAPRPPVKTHELGIALPTVSFAYEDRKYVWVGDRNACVCVLLHGRNWSAKTAVEHRGAALEAPVWQFFRRRILVRTL